MKKIIIVILLILGFSSCGYHPPMSDSVKFEVIDTLDIYDENTAFVMTNYFVLIKMDSSYYSAKMNRFGQLYEITRKVNMSKAR